jgi:hypothetical protein
MINEELDKFHEAEDLSNEQKKDLKLLVDFESSDKTMPKKQMEIYDIKYKNRKRVVVKEIDLKKKPKNTNSIF